MELQHLEVKLPAVLAAAFEPGALIPVFHDWIRAQSAGRHASNGAGGGNGASGSGDHAASLDGLLLDVADYRHVPSGPGVVLIGHLADYALDYAGGRPGLLYRRKATLPGVNAERLARAVGEAVRAAMRLSGEPTLDGALRFDANGLELVVNDRLLVPNTEASADAVLPELHAWFAGLLGHDDFTLERPVDPRLRFGATLRSRQAIPLERLLAKLG